LRYSLLEPAGPRSEIKDFIETEIHYDLSRHVDEIRPSYKFDVSSQGTVPQAIRAFLDSNDFEDAIKNCGLFGRRHRYSGMYHRRHRQAF